MERRQAELSKSSPIPLYYQLAELIRERIRSGELVPGDQLPPERELAEQTGISRMTARQAVAHLVRNGSLVVKPGVGTFVAEPKLAYDALHLLGFTEETARQGELVGSQVLEQAVVTAPPSIAHRLGLSTLKSVVKLVRLRSSGNVPLLLETSFLPAELCPGLESEDLEQNSLYVLLEMRYGLQLKRALQTLEAATANEYECELFQIQPGTPMLLLEGVTYTVDNRSVEYFKAVYRGDRLKFEVESHREANGRDVSSTPRVSVVLT